ncbi:ImmA/IrrE family metallo-endopeptidase [Bengtsoniella intestinalis]|uniref:ImmA/IrrE family metallo-endopeptidase n=1 Tax=Bengtsoniella intestinalis TaxID=3073143 RepID=UPI00391F15A4
MQGFVSQKELIELAEGLVCSFHGTPAPERVDVDGIAVKRLGLSVRYERFATADPNCIGFTSDGETPLLVYRKKRTVEVTFPQDTIILEEYLRTQKERHTRRFTLAHEVGHILQHRADPLCHAACFRRLYDSEASYSIEELQQRMQWEESHANAVAAALLIPYDSVSQLIYKLTKKKKITAYGDHVFAPETKVVLHEISERMGVSHTTLLIQLRKYKLICYRPIDEYIDKHLRGVDAIAQ